MLLDHFPVSLDFLFRTADPDRHNQILNGIRNSLEGIVRLDNFFANVRPSPLYLKYQLVEGSGATIWDDQLHVDYFTSLAAARGPFSSRKLTYVRTQRLTRNRLSACSAVNQKG